MKLLVLLVVSVVYCNASPFAMMAYENYKEIPARDFIVREGSMLATKALALSRVIWHCFAQDLQIYFDDGDDRSESISLL